jgi:hypothetical protein
MNETATGWTVPMKRVYQTKRLIGSAVCIGVAALMCAQISYAQGFISREYRPRWYQEYENFGGYDLRKNPTYLNQIYPSTYTTTYGSSGNSNTLAMGVLNRATYDPLGNFLLPGGDVFTYTWNRSRLGTGYGFDGTYTPQVFNNLMISADEFSNWQTRIMVAQGGTGMGVRAFFTPSTLKITNFGGVRWDLSSRKNNVTLLVQNNAGGPAGFNLYGVHWESILGDILNVGGTYVARQRGTTSYSHVDIDNGEKGMASSPRYVYLVLSDDSPGDTDNGPRIYDIRVKINGSDLTNQINQRVFKIPDLLNQHRFFKGKEGVIGFQDQYIYERSVGGFFPKYIEDNLANTESWFLNVMGYGGAPGSSASSTWTDIFDKTGVDKFGILNLPQDPSNLATSGGRYFGANTSLGFQEATGTDVVIYEFLIPYEARDLQFEVLAANDYCIDVVAALYPKNQTGEALWTDQPLTAAWKGKWSVFYDAKNGAKSNGNVKDYSNTKRITVSYDRFTGINVYGLNATLNWNGWYVNAEINQNNSYFSYPLEEHLSGAAKNEVSARAWFVNVEKSFERWSFGAELYNYPNDYLRYPTGSYGGGLIDDNDNDDQYANGAADDRPGLDIDWDRIVDNSLSGNAYLTYYFDSVVFGDDFNHVGGIDAREDDSAADLPYERNSAGQHFFAKFHPREKTLFTLGYYDISQQINRGRNQTDYFKFEHFQPLGWIGEWSFQHRSEYMRYNTFVTNRYGTYSGYVLPYVSDTYKATSLIHTRLKPFENLNVINDLLYTYYKGTIPSVLSAPNTLLEHARKFTPEKKNHQSMSFNFIHKADYTIEIADRQVLPDIYFHGYRIMKAKRIKEFKIQPMIKLENNWSTGNYNVRLRQWWTYHQWDVYPILRLDYRVAPNTLLRCGFQGLPGFPEMNRYANTKKFIEYQLYGYDRRRMIIAFENRTLYQGFNCIVLMGMTKDRTKYTQRLGRLEPGVTQYFINLQSESDR